MLLDEPVDRIAAGRVLPPKRVAAPVAVAPAQRAAPRQPESSAAVAKAQTLAAAAADLDALVAAIADFDGCTLRFDGAATQAVVYRGLASAPIMVIGEAPGADEDALGQPFVGRAGQLLDRMLTAAGLLDRVLITNTVFWRPPGNRTPTTAEQGVCVAFTRRHIELVRPKVLVLAGGIALKAVLETADGITRLRGKWTSYRLTDGTEIPTLPTFHPAYLLRTPASKRQSWQDMLAIDKKLKELG